MPPDSLLLQSRRACARYIRGITDIGTIPYALIRPVLLKIESPDHLRILEENCPQIVGEDAEIWLSFIKRDVPGYADKGYEVQPRDPKNWWKVYRKLKKDAESEMSGGVDKLAAIMKAKNQERETHTAVVGAPLHKDHISKRRKINYDYNSGRTGSKGAHKMTLMEKIRKEASDRFTAKRNRPLAATTSRKAGGYGAVKAAPALFVEDLRKREEKRVLAPSPTGVRKPIGVQAADGKPYDIMADREARLRALKSGKTVSSGPIHPNAPTEVRKIDFDDDENDELDDVFGDLPKSKSLDSVKSSSPQPSRQMKRKPAPALFMSGHGPKKRSAATG